MCLYRGASPLSFQEGVSLFIGEGAIPALLHSKLISHCSKRRVARLVHGREPGNGFSMTKDNDFFAILNEVEKAGQLRFSFMNADVHLVPF
jgi:hypothetical protein